MVHDNERQIQLEHNSCGLDSVQLDFLDVHTVGSVVLDLR